MKPFKDYVEIVFAVLALALLVFVCWYVLIAVPAKHAEPSGTFVEVPEQGGKRMAAAGVLRSLDDMETGKTWSA